MRGEGSLAVRPCQSGVVAGSRQPSLPTRPVSRREGQMERGRGPASPACLAGHVCLHAGYINAGPSAVARCSVSSWSQMAADPRVRTFFELLPSPSPAPSGAFPRQGRGWDPETLTWTSCLGREVASPGQGVRTRSQCLGRCRRPRGSSWFSGLPTSPRSGLSQPVPSSPGLCPTLALPVVTGDGQLT